MTANPKTLTQVMKHCNNILFLIVLKDKSIYLKRFKEKSSKYKA